MCTLAAAASVLSTGVSIAGSVVGYNQQKKQAYDQWLYNVQREAQEEKYRGEYIKYQNQTYQQDIDYGFTYLDYQKNEFKRQLEHQEKAIGTIEDSRVSQYGSILLRQVEESIATALGIDDVNRQARKTAAAGEAAAASRGVEGVTIDQIIGDVARQQGEAVTVMEMNRTATMRQLNLEMQGIKAQADSAIYNLPLQTYTPQAPVKPPAPVNTVSPSAPVPMPSNGTLTTGIIGSLVQGVSNYSKWSGTPMNSLFQIK